MTRRRAREVALQALYWAESTDDAIEETCAEMARWANLSSEARRFALDLGRRVMEERARLDTMIGEVAEHWDVRRLAVVDRIILRMALTEMLLSEDIPPKVAIDEAVELAKGFGGERSPAFVNGILDAVMKRQDELRTTETSA